MADDRWTSWQAEQAGTNRLPSVRATLLLFAVVTLLLLRALGGPAAVSEWSRADAKPPTLCAEHAGRPGWASVCPPPTSLLRARH